MLLHLPLLLLPPSQTIWQHMEEAVLRHPIMEVRTSVSLLVAEFIDGLHRVLAGIMCCNPVMSAWANTNTALCLHCLALGHC